MCIRDRFRYGSGYCERPIQFWVVLPRLDGCSVMLGLVATRLPFRYRRPVVPVRVTATCDQVFSGSWPPPVSCCSTPLPPAVMANRRPEPPPSTVRNMFVEVPVPKSKMRDQVLSAAGLTQAEIVKSFSPLTMPFGGATYSPFPESLTALPILPGTRGPVAPVAFTAVMAVSYTHLRAHETRHESVCRL